MAKTYTYPSGVSYTLRRGTDGEQALGISWPEGENVSLRQARAFYRDLSRALGVAGYLENAEENAASPTEKSIEEISAPDDA